MSAAEYVVSIVAALGVVVLGLAAGPIVFAGRVAPGVRVEQTALGGVSYRDLPGVLTQYELRLQERPLELVAREQHLTTTVGKLGVSLDIPRTAQAVQTLSMLEAVRGRGQVRPSVLIDSVQLDEVTRRAFAATVKTPRNATLQLTAGSTLLLVKSAPGEGIERVTLENELAMRAARSDWQRPIMLAIAAKAPEIQDHEVTNAKAWGEQLLREGITLTFAEESWVVKPFTVRRLIEFVEAPDPAQPTNYVLGVRFKSAALVDYLATTVAPEIDRLPQNARFEIGEEGRVTQFAVPEQGQELLVPESATGINEHVARGQGSVPLVVTVAAPTIESAEDITALGITELLTTGETDFVGSPRNRVHNITVGTARYHGLLIPPGQEFSFNEHLGPVTAAAGFKPELVIKHNVTTPEYGGGLCQVSTTIFRAAVQAGLEITNRRNHAYAVRYYGTPGFDATIYPPYTDLRFTNNTPGYILVQARIEGSKLRFEFWGTTDGRTVTVDGPHPYDRQPDGSVKATLTQTVTKDGETVLEETFYSRYKSPDLFPKVVAADQGNV